MEYRDISYVPALYKIFDEILVNAADNLQRDSKMKAGACNCDHLPAKPDVLESSRLSRSTLTVPKEIESKNQFTK